jgi:hypothetical protein
MLEAAFNSVAGFDDGSNTPKTYKEVLKHMNQAGWWSSIKKVFHAMETKGIWEVVLMSSVPAGRKVVGNRWVLNEKDDGSLISRTVSQGFSQEPVKDFNHSHALVMTVLAFRLALIIRVIMKLFVLRIS